MKSYKVASSINLSEISTKEIIEKASKKLKKNRKKLSQLQETMYAEGKYAVLICLQGMDTSGKDSLIREVFKDVNAQGVEVTSFKVPTEVELKHNYLWRHYIALPEKGKIGIFNRTHYENVLVTRVHPEYVFSENIPSVKSLEDLDDDFYNKRMDEINNFEKQITNNGTIVLKFFLNLSKEEQKNRLLRRLKLKEKNWKFSPGDLKERQLWDKYQFCYQDLLNKTSTENTPWFVIPADDKDTARYLVSEILVEELDKLNFKEPELPEKYKSEIKNYKKQLESE
ncbi:PPK2 family polyphosphate kinase [Lutibacter maritimus]|uniref:Polyphosphate:nucleotide phosphotransferase, PPK2 family n=1 Tax=Lutibacter maritimus TaxID=593133 RepID=A0A1I6RZA6_9FLAO|nr:PPK2 family polyphosphate kinase [Lutibacter maritimus]SFS70006.1 polyphosphate:nucleotide phosphotransferase, PPK2 family [Lutibacter maritimus]